MDSRSVCVGYGLGGSQVGLSLDDLRCAAIIGHGASRLASLVACRLQEAGLKVLVLDLDGEIACEISGYLDSYSASALMKDVLSTEAEPQRHAHLMASAYSTVLRLASSQETILGRATQEIAINEGYCDPPNLHEKIGVMEDFRAQDKQDLQGRIGSVKLLSTTGDVKLRDLFGKSVLVGFASDLPPSVGVVAEALFLAKLTATREVPTFDLVVVGGAFRIFSSSRAGSHDQILRDQFIRSRVAKLFVCDVEGSFDGTLEANCSTVLRSGGSHRRGGQAVPEGVFILVKGDQAAGAPFVPAMLEPREAPLKGAPPVRGASERLTLAILEELDTDLTTTEGSLLAWLSPQFDGYSVQLELGRLRSEQMVITYKPEREGPIAGALKLGEPGKLELKRLREHGKASDPV